MSTPRDRRSGKRGRREAGARAMRTAGAAPERAWKTRLVLALVLLVALWPLAHRVLVAVYDVNPWKLGGFAMYTTPTPPLLVALFASHQGRIVRLEADAMPVHVRSALRRFEQERHALGALRRPDDVAAMLLAARADLAQVAVLVQRMSLDRVSARMTSQRTQYTYDRGGLRSERVTHGGPETPPPGDEARS